MRFYLTNGYDNQSRINKVANILEEKGHMRTFDWTTHEALLSSDDSTLTQLAMTEVNAIRDAEIVICMLPSKKSAHVALGIALATRSNKRILLWSETGDEFSTGDNGFAFYFHPSIERIVAPFTELCQMLQII